MDGLEYDGSVLYKVNRIKVPTEVKIVIGQQKKELELS